MADGITRIAVEGFKSISKRQSIDIAPLTILAGANSSGKSSIMQPLLMLKQTLEAPYDPGPLKIDGPNVQFTSADQFLSRKRNGHSQTLGLELSAVDRNTGIKFSKTSRSEIEIAEEWFRSGETKLVISPEMGERQLRPIVRFLYRNGTFPDATWSVERNRFFLFAINRASSPPITFSIMHWVEPFLRGLIHVPGVRGNPGRIYPGPTLGSSFPATFQYYVASVIELWQSRNSEEALDLDLDLRRVGVAQRVVARRLNDANIDLLVNRLEESDSDDLVSVADVGFGVSQIMPVLVALRVARPGQLVYLEEPEIHLHPRAQVKLVGVLADAAKRGVRVVAETHSALILTAIQALVAKEELKPELVKLHWFQRDPKTGVTKVTPTGLNDHGAFSKRDWPEDFDEVILSAEREYLDAVSERSGP
jgi:hypothetical protein